MHMCTCVHVVCVYLFMYVEVNVSIPYMHAWRPKTDVGCLQQLLPSSFEARSNSKPRANVVAGLARWPLNSSMVV